MVYIATDYVWVWIWLKYRHKMKLTLKPSTMTQPCFLPRL